MISFHFVTRTEYDNTSDLEKSSDKLYFLYDTGEIYRGTECYTNPIALHTEETPSNKGEKLYINTETLEIKVYVDDNIGWITVGGDKFTNKSVLDKFLQNSNGSLAYDNHIIQFDNTISFKGNASTNVWYFPLGIMVIDSSDNYGNFIFNGRFGGWTNDNSATFQIMLMNRSGSTDGSTITSTVSASGKVDSALSLCDIIVCKNDDLSHTVYLKCTGYFLFNFEYNEYQHSINYNGSYITEEPSNIIWKLSEAPKTIVSETGVFSASGGIDGLDEKIAEIIDTMTAEIESL